MKTKNRLILICAIGLVLTFAIGATLAYFWAQDSVENKFNTASESDGPSPTITETGWTTPPTDSPDFPGDIRRKDPTIINKGGSDGFGRIVIQIKDKDTGRLVTDATRLALIMNMIRYTGNDLLSAPADCMTTAELIARYPAQYNATAFTYDAAKSTASPGTYYYNLNSAMKPGDSAVLFTYIIYPTDYTATEMELMGDFSIVVTGQLIQTKNISTLADAIVELDKIALPVQP